jgi:carboxypeptidase family protein
MNRKYRLGLLVLFLLGATALLTLSSQRLLHTPGADAQQPATPFVGRAVAFGISRAVRDLPPARNLSTGTPLESELNERNEIPVKRVVPGLGASAGLGRFVDPLVSNQANVLAATPGPTLTFEGNSSTDNDAAYGTVVMPPDTVGDVGPNHYVQMTNNLVRIWNKSGTALTPPFKLTSITDVVGGPCRGENDGDPVVVYDPLADRWLLSQFCVSPVPGYEMIAISQTGDPTGAYFVYGFQMPNNDFYDYPHFGVWPDAYYMTTHDFNQAGTAYLGQGAFAFDRTKMLVGDPSASYIFYNEAAAPVSCPSCGGQLPSDLDGYVPPAPGTPNLFIEFRADEFGVGEVDGLRIFAFSPNFSNPPASTFTRVGANDLALAPFDARSPSTLAPIEQPPPANAGTYLDAIADRFMFRLAYRNLGTQASPINSYVGNFTVNTSGLDPTNAQASAYQAGIRWFELRRDTGSGTVSVFDQGTHSPDAGNGATGANRWMGSIAQDNQGNIAVGYSRSSVTQNPDIVWAGRTGGAAGTLNQTETLMFASTGVQLASNNRWGDYSDITVDPSDDCTFWYTQEHRTLAGQIDPSSAGAQGFLWNTRVGNFKFPVCTAAPKGQIAATITNCSTNGPIPGATVEATGGFMRTTNASGNLVSNIVAAPGNYTVTASKPGFASNSAMTTVTDGNTSNVNICLTPQGGLPVINPGSSSIVTESCPTPNGVVDPGETVSVSLCVTNVGTADTLNLTGTLAATGGVTNPGASQNFGVVTAGGGPSCQTFTFKAANQACGSNITPTLFLTDGALNLGTVNYDITLGVPIVLLSQNFDGVTAPNLPAGWTATNATGTLPPNEPPWVTTASNPSSAPNAAFASEPATPADKMLDSPPFTINTASAKLSFRNNYDLESGFDGGVLEIRIGAGAFQDWIVAGGTFTANGYNGTISASQANLSPIRGRNAWTGSSGGYLTTTANFPASAAGQTVQLRFRMGSDNQVGVTGWRVDDVVVNDGFSCCIPPLCTPSNIALSSLGSVATASTTHSSGNFPALSAINGDRTGATWGTSAGGWNDGTRNAYPDIFEVQFPVTESINEINVFTLQNNWTTAGQPTLDSPATGEGILDFVVQYFQGPPNSVWVTIPNGNVTGNDKAWRRFTFPAVTTTKIRVVVNNSRNNWSRIVEVEAIGCPP